MAGKSSVKKSYIEVIADGDLLKSLEATRDQIATDIANCGSMRDKAALYLRLSDALQRIEIVRPKAVRGDSVDEIAARRAARRSSTPEAEARPESQG